MYRSRLAFALAMAALAAILLPSSLPAQITFQRTYGGTGDDYGYSVQQTADSGYIIAGYAGSFGAGNGDVYLIETDAWGDTVWTRTFGGAMADEGRLAQQTGDGGFVITGYTTSFGAGGSDVYLIKTGTSGDTLWTKTFGGAISEWGNSVHQTEDSGFAIAGYTYTYGAGRGDVYLIKTDASGDTLWTRTFGGSEVDDAESAQLTTDGGYVIAGETYSFGAGNSDVYLIKTDAYGNVLWTRIIGGASDDMGSSVQQTVDGGYAVAGYTESFGAGNFDVYLIKTDSLGNVAVAEPKASPTRAPALSLSCEPNPFHTRTAISLQLTADSPAELAIFDVFGRRVRTLTVDRTPFTVWDGTDELGHALPSGTYFLRLATAGQHAGARIVLQR